MGIGSSLKKLAKKIIPKEVSKAAPIVGMFNPALGAMLGVAGGLREGNLGKAALGGLGAYGVGRFAQGMGAPMIGGNMSAGLGSFFKGIPGVSQLAASPFGQGVGSFFDKVEGYGGGVKSFLTGTGTGAGTGAGTGTGAGAGAGQVRVENAAGDQFFTSRASAAADPSLKVIGEGPASSIASGEWWKGGGTPGEGLGSGVFADNPILRSLISGGLGYLEEREAKKEWEKMMAESGAKTPLSQLETDYPLATVTGTEYPYATGGIARLSRGGQPAMEMDYRGGGFIPVGARERADDVPARLSKNEFVMTADAVRAAGGGSVNQGAKRMYNLMNQLESRA